MSAHLTLVQICDHKNVGGSSSTSIKLFCHVQSALAAQVTACQANIKVTPSTNILLLQTGLHAECLEMAPTRDFLKALLEGSLVS